MRLEAHRRHVAAVERVAEEAAIALERQAALSLPDLETSVQRPDADERIAVALSELRAVLKEREQARTTLHWFTALAEHRPPKARSGDVAVDEVLRPGGGPAAPMSAGASLAASERAWALRRSHTPRTWAVSP